jgi:hypothetical protein
MKWKLGPRTEKCVRSLDFDVQDVRDLGMRYAGDQKIMDYAWARSSAAGLWAVPSLIYPMCIRSKGDR